MIEWLKLKSDIIALGFFVGVISGITIVCLLFFFIRIGVLEKTYTKTEVLLICAREGIAEKSCRI